MRTYPQEIRDEYYRANFFAVDLVRIALPDNTGVVTDTSTLRLCNGGINLKVTENSLVKTYTAQGDFIAFSSIAEDFDVKLGKFTVTLSGLTSGMVDRFMNKDFEGADVQVAKCFLNYDNLQIIDNPWLMFKGVVYNISIVESAVTCTINIDCASLWADFDRKAGRMTDNNSNWLFQQGNTSDTCFAKSGTVGQIEYKWGRA